MRLGNGIFNFVVEIPKDTRAKMEVATDEPYTPIKQDTKKGKLRYYPSFDPMGSVDVCMDYFDVPASLSFLLAMFKVLF